MKRARAEAAAFTAQQRGRAEPLENRTLVVANLDSGGRRHRGDLPPSSRPE